MKNQHLLKFYILIILNLQKKKDANLTGLLLFLMKYFDNVQLI